MPGALSESSKEPPQGTSATLRYVFLLVWFFLVPFGVAWLLVKLLSASNDTDTLSLWGNIAWLIREQPVPAGIAFFTLAEMLLYRYRYQLPLAEHLGGRSDIPKELRRECEQAARLVDETTRILERRAEAIQRSLKASAREELEAATLALREALERTPFDVEIFHKAHERAGVLVERHLSPWRKSEGREYLESIGVAILVALLLREFVVEAFKIPSGSMLPTLQLQDHIFVNKFAYGPKLRFTNTRLFASMPPKYGDVMVFVFPDPNPSAPKQDYIKRVIALPGDTLMVYDGHPEINGWKIPNCKVGAYQYHEGDALKSGVLYVEYLRDMSYLTLFQDGDDAGYEQGPYTVAEGEVWVLGDNRNNSQDSRAWNGHRGGGVPFDNIRGRAMFVWLSSGGQRLDRMGLGVMGKPTLPSHDPPELHQAVERCLANRPPVSETTPPPPKR